MKTLALLAALFTAACATDGHSTITQGNEPKQHMPEASDPSFTLYVSNQSLDRNLVDINVYIDNELAVTGDFDVWSGHSGEGCGGPRIAQHNWYEFKFKLPQGAHTIRVESADVTVTLDGSVTIDAPKFGVLDFWFDPQTPEKFDFFSSADQPYFE